MRGVQRTGTEKNRYPKTRNSQVAMADVTVGDTRGSGSVAYSSTRPVVAGTRR
jgi:hypothetical protein